MSGTDPTRVSDGGAGAVPLVAAGTPSIPDVTIERELGRGGMGAVWLGRQTYLDRAVAVKALLAVADEAFAARFRREAKILAGLSHPHVVACHSAGIAPDGRPYLVMEFVDGPDLKRHVAAHGPLPPAAAARVAREVAEGLAHAHAQGIIHRDVKAENVLLSRRAGAVADDPFPWTAKLADLGLARPAQAPKGSAANLTATGQVLGTPSTMAPEQFDDPEAVDHRADIYGLGCVLYFALTGAQAFAGRSFAEIVASKVSGPAPNPSRVARAVPTALAALCARMLDRNREQRPQDYASLIAELRACDGAPASLRTRSPRLALVAGAAVMAAILGVSVFLGARSSASPAPVVPAVVPARSSPPPAAPVLPTLSAPAPLAASELAHRLDGWSRGPGAQWSGAEERDDVSLVGRGGWIAHPLPGLPARVTATVEVPERWDWWLAGIRLADGTLIAVRAVNIGEVQAAIETRSPVGSAPADPSAPASESAKPLVIPGGGVLRLDITADHLRVLVGTIVIGEAPLTSRPMTLVLAAKSEQFVTVIAPLASPP